MVKREFKPIENENQRKICYFKRKRAIIKKAMELSILCDQEMFMVMYDKIMNKMVVYSSSNKLDVDQLRDLGTVFTHGKQAKIESYQKDDYDMVCKQSTNFQYDSNSSHEKDDVKSVDAEHSEND